MKANQILPSVPKRIALNWIFSEQSFRLGVIERTARMRPDTRTGFSVDYEVGRAPLFWLGAFRPVIGAIFASALYFALQSKFIQLGTITQKDTFTFYAFVGFLAGFSERFTHVIFGQAELTVAEALGSVPSGKDSKQTEEPPPAVDNPDA